MDINKLDSFLNEVVTSLPENPETAYDFFKTKYPTFNQDEREIVLGIISAFAVSLINKQVPLKIQLYAMAIAKLGEKPVIEGEFADDIFPPIQFGEGVNGNQLTNLFYLLKQNGIIRGSFEQIAEAISIIFPIDFNTAYKDLTEEKRRTKIKPLNFS
jgi:hypothetical protein